MLGRRNDKRLVSLDNKARRLRYGRITCTAALLICAIIFLPSCSGNRSAKSRASSSPVRFEVPVPPNMMTDPIERNEYMVQHYWDHYSAQIDSAVAEQAFANWSALAMGVNHSVSEVSLNSVYDKDPERIGVFSRKYLYDPNSPYRDEDIYGALLKHIGGDTNLALSKLCALNAVGSKANDFVFEDSRGRQHRLYGVKAEWILLFFSNPGCHACKAIIDELGSSPAIENAQQEGRLKVVNIYIDEDIDAWRAYLPQYPSKWICGFDSLLVLREDSLYHIRAIPSLYLLDKDKLVLLKDAPVERTAAVLESIL